jgi:DNA recombination protein RmuC
LVGAGIFFALFVPSDAGTTVPRLMVIGLLIGLAVGGLTAWLVMRARLAAAETALDHERELAGRFDAVAAEALRKNNESFLALASTRLEPREKAVEGMVQPIKESLDKMGTTLQGLEVARQGAYSELRTQVTALAEAQKELRNETGNLVGALRDRPNVRGRWGEIQLKRVVEMAGMLEHCDFETQKHVTTDDGRLRPDLVVSLPGGKSVVVDAKFAGQAYLESLDAKDDDERQARLRDHARHVRDHITKLSHKSYWAQFDHTPEFVVLFIPGETYLSAALEQDPGLIEEGVNQQVILATPTTLIALLRAVAYGWRQETIAESARAISDLGRELYSRLGTFTEHLAKAGRGLDGAVRSYNEAVGSLETRVLPSARKFKENGVAPAAELAQLDVLDRAIRPMTAPELPAADADAA